MSSVINPGKFRRWTTIRLVIYISRANVGLNLIFWVSRIFIVLVSQEESDKWLFLVWVILNAWMLFWNNHKKLDTTIFWIDWIFLTVKIIVNSEYLLNYAKNYSLESSSRSPLEYTQHQMIWWIHDAWATVDNGRKVTFIFLWELISFCIVAYNLKLDVMQCI